MPLTDDFADAIALSLTALIERSVSHFLSPSDQAMAVASCAMFLTAHPECTDRFKRDLAEKANDMDEANAATVTRCGQKVLGHLSAPIPG